MFFAGFSPMTLPVYSIPLINAICEKCSLAETFGSELQKFWLSFVALSSLKLPLGLSERTQN
jgi:hypothetical protein